MRILPTVALQDLTPGLLGAHRGQRDVLRAERPRGAIDLDADLDGHEAIRGRRGARLHDGPRAGDARLGSVRAIDRASGEGLVAKLLHHLPGVSRRLGLAAAFDS